MKIARGTHRIKNADGVEDGVWVEDGNQGFEVAETIYLARGYQPPLESLPWGKSIPGGSNA